MQTHLRSSHALNLRRYTGHLHDHPDGERATGGPALLVKDCSYHTAISFLSPTDVISIRAHLHFVSCNICLPRQYHYRNRYDICNVTITTRYILHDSNAKINLWDAVYTEQRELAVYDTRTGFDLILSNTGTYMHLFLGSRGSSASNLTSAFHSYPSIRNGQAFQIYTLPTINH